DGSGRTFLSGYVFEPIVAAAHYGACRRRTRTKRVSRTEQPVNRGLPDSADRAGEFPHSGWNTAIRASNPASRIRGRQKVSGRGAGLWGTGFAGSADRKS